MEPLHQNSPNSNSTWNNSLPRSKTRKPPNLIRPHRSQSCTSVLILLNVFWPKREIAQRWGRSTSANSVN